MKKKKIKDQTENFKRSKRKRCGNREKMNKSQKKKGIQETKDEENKLV